MLSGMMEPKKQQVKEIMEYKKGPLGMLSAQRVNSAGTCRCH